MNLLIACSAAAASGFGLLAVHLVRLGYLHGQGQARQALLLLAVSLSGLWSAAVGFAEWSIYTGPAHVAAGIDLLRSGAWLGLLLALTRRPQPEAAGEARPLDNRGDAHGLRRPLLLAWVALLSAGAVQWAWVWFDAAAAQASWMHLPNLGLAVLGLVLVEQLFRGLGVDLRWSAKPLCVGLAAVFAFDVYLFAEGALLHRLDPDALAIRPLAHVCLVPFVFVAVRRTGDWARQFVVSRRAAFYSTALLLVGGYLVFISAVGYYVRYFGGEWGRALQLGVGFLALVGLVVLILSAALRARVRVFIGKHFFSYRYDYREEWLAFTAMLSSNTDPQRMGELVIRAVANIVECPAGSLWTRSGAHGDYAQSARLNLPDARQRFAATDSLVRHLHSRSWLIDLDQFRRDPAAYDQLELPAWLAEDDRYWAVVPLPVGDQLLGWIVLGRPRTPVDFDWETRDLIKTASRQAAGYLAQMQATEALLESRKFDAFNRMSAFVVHDLKNIVTQLSLMLKNARRLRDNPEFQEDMFQTIENSLDRMRRMMLQLREGAAPVDGAHGVPLQPIVQRLQQSVRSAGRDIEVQVDGEPATRGHEDRLERVLGHLVQNALDATPPDGTVWLTARRESGQVCVEVGDNGKGMSEEFVRDRLFKPFTSSKPAGMGIGAYESAQYIRELGGSIDVETAEGKGTVMTVRLPAFELQRESDLMPLGPR